MEESELERLGEAWTGKPSRRQVLIADHHVDSRRLISMALIGSRYEVVAEAQDGVEALNQAITLQPDVVLIALDLPKLDAASTASLLRALPGRFTLVALSPQERECPAWADAFVLKEEVGTLGTTLDSLQSPPDSPEFEPRYESGLTPNYEFVSAAVRAMSSDLDPEKGFTALASHLRELVPYRELSLYRVQGETFVRLVGADESGLIPRDDQQPLAGPKFETTVEFKEPEFTSGPVLESGTSEVAAFGGLPCLALPLMRNGKVFALIEVVFAVELDEGAPAVRVLKQLAPALTQSVINMLAFHDLREKAAELERADEGKKALLSLLSHDLRIPISLILGFASALKQHWEVLPDGKRLEALDVIHRNSKQLVSMLEEGFEIVMAEAGELSFDMAPFDLGDLAKTIAHDFAGTHDVPVKVHVPSNLPDVMGDSRRTWRVIANLVTNAIKYGDGAPVRIAVKNIAGEVQLSVIDQGSGIRPSDMEHLFEKHYRVPEAEKSGTAGLGMGLYICKSLVEGQGGRIWAESKRFEGSTFTFTLPIAEPDQPELGPSPKISRQNQVNGINKPRKGLRYPRHSPRIFG